MLKSTARIPYEIEVLIWACYLCMTLFSYPYPFTIRRIIAPESTYLITSETLAFDKPNIAVTLSTDEFLTVLKKAHFLIKTGLNLFHCRHGDG